MTSPRHAERGASAVKHPYWIDLTLSAGADVPLLVKERDDRVRFAILTLSSLCDR